MSRRLIDRLRALARSTTFPAEREAANQKADQLEDKLLAEQASTPQNDNTWEWPAPKAPDLRGTKKAKGPWRGSTDEYGELFEELLAQARYKNRDLKVSVRQREIIARREAINEMKRRIGLD